MYTYKNTLPGLFSTEVLILVINSEQHDIKKIFLSYKLKNVILDGKYNTSTIPF